MTAFERAIEKARISGTDAFGWTCRNEETIPQEIGQLINLRRIYLFSNLMITSLPPNFHLLTNLQTLSLEDNQITSLPSTFHLLTNLQILHLGRNQIASLPSNFHLLTNLQALSLEDNQITSLPSNFHLLTNLQILSLEGNQITSLPPNFHLLTDLQELYLDNNPINRIDHQILVQITHINIPDTVMTQVTVNLPQII